MKKKYNVFIVLPPRHTDSQLISITGCDKAGVEGAKRRIEELVRYKQEVSFCSVDYTWLWYRLRTFASRLRLRGIA